MPSVSKAIVIGHVGRDPEIKTLPSGQQVANFSVATTEKWTDKTTGAKNEQTSWHRVKAFGKPAEFIAGYVTKGVLIYVFGALSQRKYTDKSGQEREQWEITADQVQLLDTRRDSAPKTPVDAPQPKPRKPLPEKIDSNDWEDEIPF